MTGLSPTWSEDSNDLEPLTPNHFLLLKDKRLQNKDGDRFNICQICVGKGGLESISLSCKNGHDNHVLRIHCLRLEKMSNQGPQFVPSFWKEVLKACWSYCQPGRWRGPSRT